MALVGYADLLEQVKVRVRTSRVQAARAVNTELVGLYWRDGCWRTTPSDLRSELRLNTALWFTHQCAT